MNYNFPMTLDKQFKEQLEHLHSKYGTEMMDISGMSPEQLDTCKFFADFMNSTTVADATIDDNANVSDKNINTMLNESQKPLRKLLSRNKIFIEMKEEFGLEVAQKFLEYDINGRIYEHDSHDSSYKPYCFAYSLETIVEKGLHFLTEMKASSPKHWDTFNHHTLEFISYATNQASGAVGIPDYVIYAYYFFKKDTADMTEENTKKYREQKFQEFVYSLNQPYLKGGIQSAYTNISILDIDHMAKFFNNKNYPDGTPILSHLNEIMDFQADFLDYIGQLRQVKWHTFPVISASLIFKDGKYVDEETAKMVVNHNWKYGFNDVNIMNVEEVTGVASCCRLVSDTNELSEGATFNSIGGSDLNVGSTKVVTLNLVRHAILADDMEGDNIENFKELITESVDIIHKYHFAHRKILKKLDKRGLLPLYKHGLMQFERQFATVGINGVFEAIDILGGIDHDEENNVKYNEDGFSIADKMFGLINGLNSETKELYGYMSNVEQSPAESASIKLNKKDRLYFGNRKINKLLDVGYNIYGNQWIPLNQNTDIFDRIETARLDDFCGGGAIQHFNHGENFNTFEDAWAFTEGLAKKGVKYYSYISIIDICANDHSFFGDTCPICGGKSVTKGIKIVGYLVKQDSFSGERKKELSERVFYDFN